MGAAVAVVAVASLGALRLVDGAFRFRYASVDFAAPATAFVQAEQIGASDLGRAYWVGVDPLEVRLGAVEPGDVVKLVARTDEGTCTVVLRAGDAPLAVLEVGPVFRQVEVVAPRGGGPLVLAPASPPCPLHLSRITLVNAAAYATGRLPLFLRHQQGRATASGLRQGWWVVVVPPLVAVVLTGWRYRFGRRRLDEAAVAAVTGMVPLAAVEILAELLLQVRGQVLVMPERTFLAVLLLPVVVGEAWRGRQGLARGARWGAAAVARLGGSLMRWGWRERSPLRRVAWYSRVLVGRGERLAHALGFDQVTARAAAAGTLAGRPLRLATAVFVAVLAGVGALFAVKVIQDFAVPLAGTGDISQWELLNAYVARNLSFAPLPRLELVNDQLFYPYGGANVFQPWVFELHLAVAAATRLAGPWGWCQAYFLASLLLTALGAFLLLVREVGAWRAGTVALAVSFANYYAIGKYAGHLGIALVHWTVLSILADAVLVARAVDGRRWSARLLLARAFLLVACLGLDLGYVAGVGLTSALVTAVFLALLVAWRGGFRGEGVRRQLSAIGRELAASARAHPAATLGLAVATLVAACLYLPLAVQVATAARQFDFSTVGSPYWWANPLRLLHPILPGCHPLADRASLFRDEPEGAFAASPGLAFVLAALAGLVAGRRRILAALPPLLLLALFLSYHPPQLAHLRALPWFSFARVTGRFSVAYPALLAAVALLAPRRRLGGGGWVVGTVVVALLGVEATTAYRLHLIKEWRLPRPSVEFTELIRTIRATPGEAVLDWPFCVAGGNGVGTGSLCGFYHRQVGIASLQAYHGKKVVGSYFGRLHPQQIAPYLAAGWPRLFLPDRRDPRKAQRQRRDFEREEWAFMERFVRLGDFAGVLLHVDLLPPETVAGFHARFGAPAAAATSLWGRLEFIPKPAAWRADTDPAAVRRLTVPAVVPVLPVGRPVAMDALASDEYLGPGWGKVWQGRRTSEGRWAELRFRTEGEGPYRFTLLGNTFRAQRVEVRFNGVVVGEWRHDGGQPSLMAVTLPAALVRPDNVLHLDFPDARTPKSLGLNDDTRLLGLTVAWMRLDPTAGGRSVEGGGP